MPDIEKQPVRATEQTYIPASIPFEQSQRKVPFATRENPDDICGMAVRIGWAGTGESDPPIYRLKLKTSLASLKTTVLPGFFVLKQGVFIPCEQWRRHRRRGTH